VSIDASAGRKPVKDAGEESRIWRVKVQHVSRPLRSVGGVALKVAVAVVGLIVVGNIGILFMSWWAQHTTPASTPQSVQGVQNLQAVDDRLWRGAAPSHEGYRELARGGVRTVVDLRAEDGAAAEGSVVSGLGMQYVHMPIRDGQVPEADQVAAFLRLVEQAPGPVFVHCGAGVGRTGAMVGAYQVARGVSPAHALRRNLAVGPPSLEQVAFVAGLDRGDTFRPVSSGVTLLSRALDFPRRAWHVIGL
jgi:uncharacterized protein (TIGR01244 family)